MHTKWFMPGAIAGALLLTVLTSFGIAYSAPLQRSCVGALVYVTSPLPGSTVSGNTTIMGSAFLPNGEFSYYKIEYSATGQNAWVVLVDRMRRSVQNGVLAGFNADALPEGDYDIRVLAVDPTGNYCEAVAGPIHISHDPNAANKTPTPSPTPGASETPAATLTTNAGAGPILPLNPRPASTPTLVVDLPTNVPGQDSVLSGITGGSKNSIIPQLPVDLGSMSNSAGAMVGQLQEKFIFGIQATAGFFILLGVVAFLRNHL